MDRGAAGDPADAERIRALVHEFATCVVARSEEIQRGDAETGNRFHHRYIAAWEALRAIGDPGRDALAWLFAHSDADVRVAAACVLLRHRHAEARAVLEEEAHGGGLAALGAELTLERWDKGEWTLDPG